MKVFENIEQWQELRRAQRRLGVNLGFVPTMGALHAGHLSLIEKAKKENDQVCVSIFINPTQFNNAEDFEKYPHNPQHDLEQLAKIDTDFVLMPTPKQIYPDDYRYKISESADSEILCGQHRPGHFTGVLTVVMRLLQIAQAENAYFGEKDYQQYRLIAGLAKNFFLETKIIGCPIVREESGLAMSSRNERLTAAGREKAALIYQSLRTSTSCAAVRDQLTTAGFEVEYVEEHWGRRFVAAWIDGVRLIDNVGV
jgi:pantoate--beta-alanine ligase